MIGAQRVEAPKHGDHPWLVLAWREAKAPRTIWRKRYNMPPNDPRVLEADDELVLRDLLTLRYNDLMTRLSTSPSFAAKYASEDPKVQEAMMSFKEQVVDSIDFLASAARGIENSKHDRKRGHGSSLEPVQIGKVTLREEANE